MPPDSPITRRRSVNYTYSNGLLASKTDAKGQQLTYQYDSYHRLTSVTYNSQILRTYYYDSNPFVGGFSQYASSRLAAVQYAPFGPGANPTITLRDMTATHKPDSPPSSACKSPKP